jgi:alkylation response protein AidB-like acyl-CoA dehydrogenase
MTLRADVGEPDIDLRAVADGLNDALVGNGGRFDRAAWRKLAAGGWLHMLTDGPGAPAGQLARLISPMEQWGAALAPGPILLTLAWTLPVLRAERLADDIARGVVVTATRELTSVDAGPAVRAAPDAGGWRLTGQARLVPWLPDADTVLVMAATEGTGHADTGRLVAAVPVAGAGVRSTADETLDPGVSVGDLELDGALAATVIEADAAALRAAAATYSLALDAQAVGGAAELISRTVRYVTDRHQFGQPVGSFQAIRHRLADMVTATESARALLWLAADRLASQPLDPPWEDIDASRVSCGDAFRKVATDAIQCYGGMGFTWEEGIHLYYRRALVSSSVLSDVEAATRRLVRHGIGRSEATA